MKILITGTSGRIGSALAFALKNKYQIIGIDIKPGPFTTHLLDITNRLGIFQMAKRCWCNHSCCSSSCSTCEYL